MTKKLMKSTQVSVILSVNIISRKDGHEQLIPINLMTLTTLVMLVWSIRQKVNRFRFTLAMLAQIAKDRLTITGKVIGIGFNSLVWGLL